MQSDYDDFGRRVVFVPLELEEDFKDCDYVQWHDNGDGTFLLKVFDIYKDI